MPERRYTSAPGRRSYRSARRRAEEAPAQPMQAQEALALSEREAPPSDLPLPIEETGRTALKQIKKPSLGRKIRTVALWVLLPLLVLGGGLTAFHLIHAAGQPQPDPAIAEREAYERTNFPLYYRALIEQNADTYELPASLIAAVVLSESSFTASANNRINARGLMQLMPDTAQWIAEKLSEEEGYSFENLFDPAKNLQYGCWYLSYLYNRFDGDAKKAVSAYHAGQGNVDSWLANPNYSSDGVTLDTIPTEDTAAYVNRVLNAQQIYQRRYFAAREGQPQIFS